MTSDSRHANIRHLVWQAISVGLLARDALAISELFRFLGDVSHQAPAIFAKWPANARSALRRIETFLEVSDEDVRLGRERDVGAAAMRFSRMSDEDVLDFKNAICELYESLDPEFLS